MAETIILGSKEIHLFGKTMIAELIEQDVEVPFENRVVRNREIRLVCKPNFSDFKSEAKK